MVGFISLEGEQDKEKYFEENKRFIVQYSVSKYTNYFLFISDGNLDNK